MSINTVPISSRTLPYDPYATAGGGYTLPRYAFIPHPALQQLSTGFVGSPGAGGQSAAFASPYQLQRAYPSPVLAGIYGFRALSVKSSPSG